MYIHLIWSQDLYGTQIVTDHEIEDTLDINNRNSFTITTNKNLIINYYYFMFKIRAWNLELVSNLN